MDRDGKLIHEPPSPTNPHQPDVTRERPPAPCVACQRVHGGVGAERICLRARVVYLQAELVRVRELFNDQEAIHVREMAARDRTIEGLRGLLELREATR
jgi:hypothetical protein